MSDDKNTALPERLRAQATWVGEPNGMTERIRDVMLEAADALEASVQAPAVDREAFERIVATVSGAYAPRVVDAILASGVLQDAAEGARAGYDAGYTNGGYDQSDRIAGIAPSRIEFDESLYQDARAQQVREGK